MKKITWDLIYAWSKLPKSSCTTRTDLRPFAGLHPIKIAVLAKDLQYIGRPTTPIMNEVYQRWSRRYSSDALFFLEFDAAGPIRCNWTRLSRLPKGASPTTIPNYALLPGGFFHTWAYGTAAINESLWQAYHPTKMYESFVDCYKNPGWVTLENFSLPLYGCGPLGKYKDIKSWQKTLPLFTLRGEKFKPQAADSPTGRIHISKPTIQNIPIEEDF